MAYIRKIARRKGVIYRVEISQPDGSKTSRSFRTREEAVAWSHGQEDSKRASKYRGVINARITFDDFFRQWMLEYARVHHSPGWQLTDESMYRLHVQRTLGQRMLREIEPFDIQKVLNTMLANGLASSSANRVRQLLHKIFQEAVVTHRFIGFNPVTPIRPFRETPKPTVYLSASEAQRLLQWADTQALGLGLHLALQLGLREGEIVGLKWDAVDFERRRVTVRRKWEKKAQVLDEFAKGKKIRHLGLYPDELRERLARRRELFPNTEFVVCNSLGGMIKPDQLIYVLDQGVKATGIPKVTVHGLRHTFASLYMQAGGNLFDLQKLMGHESVSTTERYRHIDPDYLKSRSLDLNLYARSAQIPPKTEKAELKLVHG